ncbi:uncharacterized protein LOC8036220 [Ixodes scapularis]|uniref:uncharacterized protein LOC8036220 n=1 Tax=Ixodes scapularis TaxID=6945 RepID=UPI001A9DEA84|nr:uncharacterized protein LOC8036220 [Ixodes scapularis]
MGACSALGCKNRVRCGKNRTTSNSGVSFHRFPKKKELQDAWVAAMKRNGWRPNSSSLLCSVHFREEDMDRTSRSCIRLRDNVVPSLFPERKRRRSLGSSSLVAPVDGDHCYGMPVPSDMDTSLRKSEHSEEVTTDTADQDDNSCGDLQCFADAAVSALQLLHQGVLQVDSDESSETNLGKAKTTKDMQSLSRDHRPFPHLRPIVPKPVAAPELTKENVCIGPNTTDQQPAGPAQLQVLVKPGLTRGVSLLKKGQSGGENHSNTSKPDGLMWGLQRMDAAGEAQEVIILKGVGVGGHDSFLQQAPEMHSPTVPQTPAPEEHSVIPEDVSQMCIPRIVSVTGSQQHASTAEVQRPAILVQQLMATTCTSSLRDHIRLLKVGQYPSASTSHSSLSGPAAKTSIMPDLPSNEMDEKMQLWDTIQKFRSLHNADRKKIKSLQECVRRLRVRNEKLKKALADKSASLPMTKLEFCKMDESQRKTLTLRYMDPPCCCCSEDT